MSDKTDFDSMFSDLPKKPLLRVDEVAAFFSVSKKTIYNWYPDLLRGTKIKGGTRIYRQSVIDLVMKTSGLSKRRNK